MLLEKISVVHLPLLMLQDAPLVKPNSRNPSFVNETQD